MQMDKQKQREYNRLYYQRVGKPKRAEQRDLVVRETGPPGQCHYCGVQMTLSLGGFDTRRPTDSTVNHVIPIKQGGTDDPANTVACCRQCNNSKGDNTLEDWRVSLQAMACGVRFSRSQIGWLRERGFEYEKVVAAEQPHLFWFETQ